MGLKYILRIILKKTLNLELIKLDNHKLLTVQTPLENVETFLGLGKILLKHESKLLYLIKTNHIIQ